LVWYCCRCLNGPKAPLHAGPYGPGHASDKCESCGHSRCPMCPDPRFILNSKKASGPQESSKRQEKVSFTHYNGPKSSYGGSKNYGGSTSGHGSSTGSYGSSTGGYGSSTGYVSSTGYRNSTRGHTKSSPARTSHPSNGSSISETVWCCCRCGIPPQPENVPACLRCLHDRCENCLSGPIGAIEIWNRLPQKNRVSKLSEPTPNTPAESMPGIFYPDVLG
jgi:hypothetical protein